VLQKVSFPSGSRISRSVEDATFICGDHVLNVDESVFATVLLEEFESSLDEVTQVLGFALGVVDLVSEVHVLGLEEVEDGEDLSVVGYERFSDGVGAEDELLEDLESHLDDFKIAGVKGGLNWDDQLGDDGEDLGATLLEHVEDTLDREESVGVDLLTDTFEEDGEVMMVVELGDINFPVDLVLGSVVDGDGEISSVVEASELTGRDGSRLNGSSSGSGQFGLLLGFGERGGLTSTAVSLLKGGSSTVGDRELIAVNGLDGLNLDGSLDSAVLGEVTEGGVHVLGTELVVIAVEWLATC